MKNQKIYLSAIIFIFIIMSCDKESELSKDISDKVVATKTAIGANDEWYAKLIPESSRSTAMVNASNEDTDRTGSGGLNEAFQKYFDYKEQDKNSWGRLYKSDGQEHQKGQKVKAGDFVYSKHKEPVAFDWQLHAVGPKKSDHNTAEAKDNNFAEAQKLIENMTYNMLEFARLHKIDNIVIPSISTGIFSGQDEVFIDAMFDGMSQGVIKFINKNGFDTKPDKIYLTWRDSGIERFKQNWDKFKETK